MSKANDIATYGQYQPQRRNLIINGGFNIWQRGTSFAAVGNLSYTADRWFAGTGGTTAVATFVKSVTVPAEIVGNSLKVDVTTADASVAATDLFYIAQRLEGYNVLDTAFGTTGAKELSLSFWVKSSKSGTHTGAIVNEARDRSYTFEYTVDTIDTWQKIKVENIPGDTTGTWTFDEDQGFELRFALMVGSNFGKTAGSWGATDVIGTANQVNLMDNTANNFHLAEVQLEVGTEATDFEYRPIGEELSLCQRYYQKSYIQSLTPAEEADSPSMPAIAVSAAQIRQWHKFIVTMRSVPSMTFYKSDAGATDGRWSYWNAAVVNSTATTNIAAETDETVFVCDLAVTGRSLGDAYQVMGGWTADAEL